MVAGNLATRVVMGGLGRTKAIIQVINGRFMVVLMLLMLASLVHSCFNVGNVWPNPNVVLRWHNFVT